MPSLFSGREYAASFGTPGYSFGNSAAAAAAVDEMPCFVPFNGNEMQLSFFAFRHVGVFADELIDALRIFSFFTEGLGCVCNAVFKTIHGSMVVWYGAWIKRPDVQRKMLFDHLISALENVSHLAVLLEHGFFESYAGESKDGRPFAKLRTGDTVSMAMMTPITGRMAADLSYACLAVLKSYYLEKDGIASGACFRGLDQPVVATAQVWESLRACYAWLLDAGFRRGVRPYVSHLSDAVEYDVFKVVHVSDDGLLGMTLLPPLKMIGQEAAAQDCRFYDEDGEEI